MDQKTARLYSSSPLVPSPIELEDWLEKTIIFVNSFDNSINDKKVNSNFRGKNHQLKKKSENYEALITILQSTANLIKIGTTINSATVIC